MPTPSANYNVVNAVENDVEIDIPGEEKALFSREDSLVAETVSSDCSGLGRKSSSSSSGSSNSKTLSADSKGCRSQRIRRRIRRSCTVKMVKRRLPILQWLPNYTFQSAFYDCIAGFTVALTAIPQSIAYAAVAGIPLEYGLYTAFAGPFIYSIFGSVRQITMGPTAVMAIMTQAYTQIGGAPYAIILSFLAGCFELLAGLLNLGFLMEFISGPVISGFVSAAATITILSQLKTILGLKFRGSAFTQVVPGIFTHWRSIRPWDTILGLSFILFLQLLKNLTEFKKCFSNSCCLHNRMVDKALWFVATCRNALAVILGVVIAYVFQLYGEQPFNLTGEIKSGIPSFQLPPFGFNRELDPIITLNASTGANWTDLVGNVTYEWVSFETIISDLGTGLALVPVIAILEQIAIAKAFSSGGKTDSTQEMIAMGLGSIFCSFFGCMPLTASFSRSSVLSASGGRTQLASCFNGGVILLALAFLMPTFSFIPKSVLGAVIITAVYPMIEFHEIIPMWKGRRVELFPFTVTFLCCLFINMEYGILIGAQLHLLLLAYEATRSKSDCVRYKNPDGEKVTVRVDRNLYFPSVERFRNALNKAAPVNKAANRTIVIDMARVTQVDHTSLKMVKSMLSTWDKKGEKYSFINASHRVQRALQSVLPASTIISGSTETIDTDIQTSFAITGIEQTFPSPLDNTMTSPHSINGDVIIISPADNEIVKMA